MTIEINKVCNNCGIIISDITIADFRKDKHYCSSPRCQEAEKSAKG